jgi:hypothetical protein
MKIWSEGAVALCFALTLLGSAPAKAQCVPSNEVCNGIDDDCDALVDRNDTREIVGNFFRYDKPQCEKFVGVCAGAYKTVAFCRAAAPWGWTPCTTSYYTNHAANSGTTYQLVESGCDGRDNDCDGLTDEGFTPSSITCGVGACQRNGWTACVNGQVLPANCTPGQPGTEVCNGLDDDCDGLTDEDLGVASCGIGECRR